MPRPAAGLTNLSQLAVSEEYLVAGRIRLGTLLDLVAAFLDTLDLLVDIPEAPKLSMPGAAKRPAPAETGRA
jgi:hypothetical protein